MSLAPTSGIVRTANPGGGVSTSSNSGGRVADESSLSTMCYKRPGYNGASEEQQGAPGDGGEYPGEREAKLRRLTPGLEAGGTEAAAAVESASSAQQAGRHCSNEGVGAGAAAPAADNPRLKRNKPVKWSAEEDRRLRDAVVRFSEARWKDIASLVETRNHVQCLQRWKKVLKPGLVKGQWSAEEDDRLVGLVEKGFRNWGQVASFMDGRTSKQCRERWCHHLDPAVRKGGYTTEEDELIIFLQGEVGNRWADIAKRLTGRTENAVKIRWKALNRRQRDARNKAAAAASSGSGVHRPLSRHPAGAGGAEAGGGHLSPASSLSLSSSSLLDTGAGAGDGANGRERMPGGGVGAAHHHNQQQQQYQQQRPRSVARTSSTSSTSSSSSLSSSPPNFSGVGGGARAADAGASGARAAGMSMRPSGGAPWSSSTNGGGPSYDNHPTQPWTSIEDDGRRSSLNPSTFAVTGVGGGAATAASSSRQQAHTADPAASSLRRIELPLEMAAGAAAVGTGSQQGSMEVDGAAAPVKTDQITEVAAATATAAERLSPSRAENMDVAGDGGLHRLCAALRNVEAMDGIDESKGGDGANSKASAAGACAPPSAEQVELKPPDAAAAAATGPQSVADQAATPQPRPVQNGDPKAATAGAEVEQSQPQEQQQKPDSPTAEATAQSHVRV